MKRSTEAAVYALVWVSVGILAGIAIGTVNGQNVEFATAESPDAFAYRPPPLLPPPEHGEWVTVIVVRTDGGWSYACGFSAPADVMECAVQEQAQEQEP